MIKLLFSLSEFARQSIWENLLNALAVWLPSGNICNLVLIRLHVPEAHSSDYSWNCCIVSAHGIHTPTGTWLNRLGEFSFERKSCLLFICYMWHPWRILCEKDFKSLGTFWKLSRVSEEVKIRNRPRNTNHRLLEVIWADVCICWAFRWMATKTLICSMH